MNTVIFYASFSASGCFVHSAYLSVKSLMFRLLSVASTSSDHVKADDMGGDSSGDRSADEALGIVGAGVSTQQNCTLCAGAITQEVSGSCV